MKTALLVGGGAASGRLILDELRARGYQITVFNRGRHNDGLGDDLEFIRGDPHFADSVRDGLAGRSWDVAIVTYGRVQIFALELRGRVGQLITISGMPAVASTIGSPLTENDETVTTDNEPARLTGIAAKIASAESVVLEASRQGHYAGSIIRYPYTYGPHTIVPMEWHVIQRCLDRRTAWILHGDGLAMTGRCASPNAAALVGTVLDKPEVAAGNVYHAADERQLTQREWIETVAGCMGHEFRYVDIPASIAPLDSSSAPLAGEIGFIQTARDLKVGVLRHHVPSPAAARRELGYIEKVDPLEWIAKTVEWELANPPATDGSHPSLSPLDFNYAAEDSLLAWWESLVSGAPTPASLVKRGHAYEHPKACSL